MLGLLALLARDAVLPSTVKRYNYSGLHVPDLQ